MRSNLSDNIADRIFFASGTLGTVRDESLTEDYTIPPDGPISYYFNPTADRVVTLPPFKRGAWHSISHIGAAHNIVVKDFGGVTLVTLIQLESTLLFCSGNEWRPIAGGVSNVLDPTEVTSPDGSIDVQIIGGTALTVEVVPANVDHDQLENYVANEHIDHSAVSIGTLTGSGLQGGGDLTSTRQLSLDINSLTGETITINDFIVFYDIDDMLSRHKKVSIQNMNLVLVHGNLSGYVAAEHVNHNNVEIQAGEGLGGGGTIASTRTISLDFGGLNTTLASLASNDKFAFYDVSDAEHKNIGFLSLNGALDHDVLTNFVTSEHVDHTAVTISVSSGLTGGGTIAASRNIALNFNGLSSDTIVGSDYIPFYDVSGGDHNKVTVDNLKTAMGIVTNPNEDDERRNLHLGYIYQSKTLGDIRRGVKLLGTGFKAATDTLRGINVAGSSNYDTTNAAASGYISPTITAGASIASITPIGSMTSGGGLAAAFNGTTNQGAAASAFEPSGTLSYIGQNYSTSPKQIGRSVTYGANDAGYIGTINQSITINLYGRATAPSSAADTAGATLLGTITFNDTTNESGNPREIVSSDQTTAWNYVWRTITGDSVHATICAEVIDYLPDTINSMTLTLEYQTSDVSLSFARALVEIEPTGTITPGTDLSLEVTCDGGANWTATTETKVGLGQAGRIVIESDEVACTAGTSFSARIKNPTNKMFKVFGATVKAR